MIPNYNEPSHDSVKFIQLSIIKVINRQLISKNTVTFFIVFDILLTDHLNIFILILTNLIH